MERGPLIAIAILIFVQCSPQKEKSTGYKWSDNIQTVLDNTTVLEHPREDRLPLYLWPAIDPGELDDAAAERLVKLLDERGVGIVCSWKIKDREKALPQAMTIARAQKKLNKRVNIDATALLDAFYNGDGNTAHIDKDGKPFFDDSFGPHKMGCPFAIDFRKKEIRDRVEFFVKEYKKAGLPLDFIFTDWEIDGPIEVNGAFEASKKCTRCTHYLGEDFKFDEFQKTMRNMRSYLVNYSYSSPVLKEFPAALVGNYAVYPNDGYRYWYDYFEYYAGDHPFKSDQRARYRKWYNDFPLTGFTFAMPVVYPWAGIYSWYDFKNTDYRWFYNMLLNASNAGKSTPANIPIIAFVHWNTIFAGTRPDSTVRQMSREVYKELLWHMLLRGTDTFFMWSGKKEFPGEVKLLHEVYAEAQQFGNFLEKGLPINFDVPDKPGVVISGLVLGDSVLVRRTDFGDHRDQEIIMVGTKPLKIDQLQGMCRILSIDQSDK